MAVNKTAKGNYYRLKTKKFFEADGYEVVNSEVRKAMPIKGRLVWIATDIFASDLIAMNGEEMIFIQVKANRTDVSKAVIAFSKHNFPATVRRVVVWWPPRSSVPEIFNAGSEDTAEE